MLKDDHMQMLKEIISTAPNRVGIYFFYNDKGFPLYIGKSIHIKKRLLSHYALAKKNHKEARLFAQTAKIIWEETASEFAALLLEASMIKKKSPTFNKKLRRAKKLYTLCLNYSNDYGQVNIVRYTREHNKETYGLFASQSQAKQVIRKLIKRHGLCLYTLDGFKSIPRKCFNRQLHQCDGACELAVPVQVYNQRLKQSLSEHAVKVWPYPGKIAVRDTVQNLEQYHVFDHWIYLQTNERPVYIPQKLDAHAYIDIDRDYYRILLNFLKTKSPDAIKTLE